MCVVPTDKWINGVRVVFEVNAQMDKVLMSYSADKEFASILIVVVMSAHVNLDPRPAEHELPLGIPEAWLRV